MKMPSKRIRKGRMAPNETRALHTRRIGGREHPWRLREPKVGQERSRLFTNSYSVALYDNSTGDNPNGCTIVAPNK